MAEATFSVNQLFTDDNPTNHTVEVGEAGQRLNHIVDSLNCDDRSEFFQLSETISWIKENELKRIALQFPDSFLKYAKKVAADIELGTGVKVFILADTSYRSCCVDEVAAAHANCDGLVHYGDACLSSPTLNIPVKYLFGRLLVDIPQLSQSILSHISTNDTTIVLLSDAPYAHALSSVVESIKESEREIITCDLLSHDSSIPEGKIVSIGRLIPSDFSLISSATLLFIGDKDSPLLPLWLMTHPQCSKIIHFDPSDSEVTVQSSSSWRQLRKRLFLIEKLRDANTVGLVVGSVGVSGHKEAVHRMRELCKKAQKKIYVISVGKVNVPKLSNFSSDIDVFVLLSCPFGVILDCSEFYRPVLSMFEAEIALNPSREWMADKGWTAEFGQFINDSIGDSIENEQGDVSLITGRVRVRKEQTEEESADSTNGAQVALYTAGDYFKERSWHGLDDSVRIDESTTLEEGRKGIAVGYNGEK